jgi:hydroxyethylthiazole kinase-like uncharacterized protein yjeF
MPGLRLTRAQMREVDRLSIEEYGIPGLVLMENAGRSVFEWIASNCVDTVPGREPWRCVVLCGPGNNGGDGFVVARWLFEHDLEVECWCTAGEDAARGDARSMRAIARAIGVPMRDISDAGAGDRGHAPRADEPVPTVVVDALLGTGFEGRPRPPIEGAIRLANDWRARGARVVSIDVPSGLDCDSGRALGDAVRADMTVTFECPKSGFDAPEAREFLGQVVIASVGAPRDALDRARGSERRRLTSG